MPAYTHISIKPCQALNLCRRDSREKHCFNLIFLDVSISLRFEPCTQLLWPEIEANLLKQQHLRRCPMVHELQTRSEGCQVRPKKKSRLGWRITASGLLQQSKLPHITHISAVSCVDVPSLFLLHNKACWLQTSLPGDLVVQKHVQVPSSHSVQLFAGWSRHGPRPHTHNSNHRRAFSTCVPCPQHRARPLPLTGVLRQTHLRMRANFWSTSTALHEECTGAHCEMHWGRVEGGFTSHEVKSVTGNKAEILFLLLFRAITKFTTPVKAQGSLPCQRAQESRLISLRWQLLSHTDLSADTTRRELWRGLSCNNTRSKSTLLKVSVYSIQLGQGRASFSPF